jgi:hypothetical protein
MYKMKQIAKTWRFKEATWKEVTARPTSRRSNHNGEAQ